VAVSSLGWRAIALKTGVSTIATARLKMTV
jgi:hypothetical protein